MGKGRWWLVGGLLVGAVAAAKVVRRRQDLRVQRARNAGIRVLVIGAGVVGSTYAEHLSRWGLDVTVLSRGARLRELSHRGLWVRDMLTRRRRTARVRLMTAGDLSSAERAKVSYDLVIVAVRATQILQVLDLAKPLVETTPILILQNNMQGADGLARHIGHKSLLLGFPATGGVRANGEVTSAPLWIAPTMIGESDGAETQRLQRVATILRRADMQVEVQRHVVPWLQTHAAMITALAGCAYKHDGHVRRMAASPAGTRLYLATVREAYTILLANGIPITPQGNLRIVERPVWLQTAIVAMALWVPWGALLVDGHLRAAPEEMRCLYDDLMQFAQRACVEADRSASGTPSGMLV
jgi:2-dehydropantoate 2-reductase